MHLKNSSRNTHLVHFIFLKLLQLPLEAQVGVGTGPPSSDGVQGIFPTKVSDSHDVCDHQSHTPGDSGQAVEPRQCKNCRSTPPSIQTKDLTVESLSALRLSQKQARAYQRITQKYTKNFVLFQFHWILTVL